MNFNELDFILFRLYLIVNYKQFWLMILRLIIGFSFKSKITNVQMCFRKMKSSQVHDKISKKLKSANFFNEFNKEQQDFTQNKEKNQLINKNQENQLQKKKFTQNLLKTIPRQLSRQPSKKQRRTKVNQYNNKQIVEIPKLEKALKTLGKALEPINPKDFRKKGIDQVANMENKEIKESVQDMKKLSLKDFSILIHRLLINSTDFRNTDQKYIWKEIEDNFIQRFQITSDPVKIRSYSKIIYCMAKSKVHKDNSKTLTSSSISTNLQSFQTKFALLLPSATHQSFATIITSLSRMGPLSEQFAYIAERLYYNKYSQFNAREKVQINYALTRNGRQVDNKLVLSIEQMNLKEILIMLRCHLNCGGVDPSILTQAEFHIILRKKQMNAIDIGDVCFIYFEAIGQGYQIKNQMEVTITQMYSVLRKNINQITFQKIWAHLPDVINKGFLQVQFMEEVIKTLKILHKKNMFPERIWKPLRQSFKKFENLELRKKLEDIG